VNPHFTEFLSSQQPDEELEIEIRAEADEFWSYVGKKKNQRWTWYAVERKSGMILAWHNGRRTDESCFCLMEKLSVFPEALYYTDDWRIYSKYIPPSKHVIGKTIERRNLNFRTHIKRLSRRTICFSKDEKIHDNVIGMYINRYYFENGQYSENT
jgi:insertion element IS1 protein InsB